MKNDQKVTLIVGGSGKTGRRVAERLEKLGHPMRLASRRSPVPFEWAEPGTWEDVLRGIGSVYLTFPPDLAVPGASELIRAFSARAVASGVENIVLLSGRGEPQVLPSEQAVRESGARFTILRAAWFAQNFSEGHLAEQVRSGVFEFPGGDCAEPFLDIEDIADVAVAALTDSRHSGKIYELTGPRLLTFQQAMAEISAAAGRTITYVPISKAEYRAALLPYLPAEEVFFMTDLFEAVLDGHNAHIANGVELALGRKARDFGDFAREAGARGAFGARAAE